MSIKGFQFGQASALRQFITALCGSRRKQLKILTTMRANRTGISGLLALMWCLLSVPAFGSVQGQPAGFGLTPDTVGAFVVSDTGVLYRVVWDTRLNSVTWENLGGQQLRASSLSSSPLGDAAFLLGGDGNLYVKYFDGQSWWWSYQGNPGVTLSGNTSYIRYESSSALFVVGDNNRLYVRWWNGAEWPQSGNWYDLDGTQLTHYVAAQAYYDNGGLSLHIKVYVVGGDGNLYVKFWDGSWEWQFVGRPKPNVSVAFPGVVSIGPDGNGANPVLVAGSDGHLYSWDAAQWTDRGGSQLANPPQVVYEPKEVFIVGGNGTLYANEPDLSWHSPGGCNLRPLVSAVTANGGTWVFVIGGNGRLYGLDGGMHTDFCYQWYGTDLGAP